MDEVDSEGLTADWLNMTSMYYGGMPTHRHSYGFSDVDVGSISCSQSETSECDDDDDDADPASHSGIVSSKSSPAESKPFLYSGRMCIISMPGLATLLMLVGEMLLVILTCGAFVIYLLQNDNDKEQYLVAYFMTFVCAEFAIFYAVLPLIWLSLVNILLLTLVNMFCGLSAAWLLLTFTHFTNSQPQLAQMMEALIFALSPFVSVCFVTWFLANCTTLLLSAYYFLLIGFIVGQWFLTPVTASFSRSQSESKQNDAYVLGPYTTVAVTSTYCITPAVILIFTSHNHLISVKMLMEILLIISSSISLATFFNLRLAFEIIEIPYCYVKTTRRSCALLAMFTLSWVLHHHGMLMSHWLPWLPFGLMLHVIYGMLLSSHYQKWLIWIGTSAIITFYVFLFLRLPWSLHYHVWNGALHINVLYAGLLLNIFLCLASLHASVFSNTERSTALLLACTLVFVTMEQILLNENLYSHSVMAILVVFWEYVLLRLHYSDKLPWQPALLMMVLHLSCLLTNVGRSLPGEIDQSRSTWLRAAYQFSSTSLLTALLLRVGFFETEPTIHNTKLRLYMVCTVIVSFMCAVGWLPLLQCLFYNKAAKLAPAAGFTLCAVSIICTKLSLCHVCHVKHLRYLAAVAMTTALCVLYVQPHFQLTWNALLSWMQMACILTCLLLPILKGHIKSDFRRLSTAAFIGGPLGVCCAMLFVTDAIIFEYSVYALQMFIVTDLALVYWLDKSVGQETQIITRLAILLVLPAAIVFSGWLATAATYWSARLLLASSAVFSAVITNKIRRQQQKEQLAKFQRQSKSALPVVCDMTTWVAFFSACCLSPIGSWEVWVTCCSFILLLLRHPHAAALPAMESSSLCTQHAFWPAVVLVAVLDTSTVLHCRLWGIQTLLHISAGCLEIIVMLSLLPIYYVLVTVLHSEQFFISDRYVVFLTPLASLLFLLGSSYSAWLLALYSLTAGAWLMKYKLPLEVTR